MYDSTLGPLRKRLKERTGCDVTLISEDREPRPLAVPGLALARTSGLILVLSLLTIGLGFGVQVVLAARLGTSRVMDAYLVAVTLPALGATVALIAFPSVLVPAIRGRIARGAEGDAESVFRAALVVSAGAGILASFLLSSGAHWIVRLTAPGLGLTSSDTAAGLLRIAAIGLAFDSPRAVLMARHYATGRYFAPQLAPSLNHVILLATALLFLPRWGIMTMAFAWTGGSAAMLGVMAVSAFRRPSPSRRLSAGWVGLGALPAALALAALSQTTPFVDRWVASFLPEGAISSLGYGSRVLEAMLRTIPMGVVLAVFPVLSEHAARRVWPTFARELERSLRLLLLGVLPLFAIVVTLRQPLITILFQRGSFGPESTLQVAQTLLWYGLAFVPASLAYAFQHALLAAGRVALLTKNAAMVLLATILLDLALAERWGHVGVATAYFVLSIGMVGLMGFQLHRMGIHLDRIDLRRWLWKTCGSAALMLGVLWLIRATIPGNGVGRADLIAWLGLASLLGLLIYGLALLRLRVPEVVRLQERVVHRLRH